MGGKVGTVVRVSGALKSDDGRVWGRGSQGGQEGEKKGGGERGKGVVRGG